MPCNSDGYEPTDREYQLQRTARLLVYAAEKIGRPVKPEWEMAAADPYCKMDLVPELCSFLRGLEPPVFDSIVYDARSKQSRDLADWWEEHEAHDRDREAREKAEAKRQKLAASGMAKLTPAERKALGIKDK